MKSFSAIALLVFCGSLLAQTPRLEMVSVSTHSKPAAISHSSQAARPDLNDLLVALGRITASTDSDVSALQAGKWKSGWFKGTGKHQAAELVASLDQNLKEAMPTLIRATQESSGSVTATFKLYNDLSVLVESVGSLAETADAFGRKAESNSLRNDYHALSRLRQELASYIQMTADSLEPRDEGPRHGSPSYASVLSACNRAPSTRTGSR